MFDRLMEHSSKGNTGNQGEPDIMFRFRDCAVMIEVKHGTEKQVSWNWENHPCSDSKTPSKNDSKSVKKFAENGAVHYLQHALDHKRLLDDSGINLVLSVGVSFEDSGDFIAVPYYGNAESGEIFRLRPFHLVNYFSSENFDKELDNAREVLTSGSLDGVGKNMRNYFNVHGIDFAQGRPFFMTLMWAMSNPNFKYVRLKEKNNIDTVLDYCEEFFDHFKHTIHSEALLKSFGPNGSNRGLVPELRYADIARYIDEILKLTASEFWYTAVISFGLEEDYLRAKIIAQTASKYGCGNTLDIRSNFGIISTIINKEREGKGNVCSCKMVLQDPVDRLGALALINLLGLRVQEEYPDFSYLPKNFNGRSIVADFTAEEFCLDDIGKAMTRCGKGKYGLFTIGRKAIVDKSTEATATRSKLNTKYTLERLVGCKGFFLVVLKNEPNDRGKATQYFDQHRLKPNALLDKFDKAKIEFNNYKLKNGVWYRPPQV